MPRTNRENEGETVANPVSGFATLNRVEAKAEREKGDSRTN